MTRIKFVDVPPFQDASKIEARLMATLRRLRDLPRQPDRAVWEDEDDFEPKVKGKPISYNDNQMRILGRWMRMLTISNRSSVPKAFQEFDEAGRMRPSPLYDRIVDVMEELVKFAMLTRHWANYLVDRYSERKESAEALMRRVNLSVAT